MSGEKVLVVEDSIDILSFLSEDVLPYHGYQVVTATTGQQGLEKLASDGPDLLLLDLELPDMSGMDIVKALQKDDSDVPVVLMTAYGSESVAVEAFRLGVRDYIIKPFTTEQVLDVLERTLMETRLRREKSELTESLQQRVEQMTILSAVGKSVVSLMDLEELLNRIVEAGVYVTRAEEGFLLLVDPETQDLYLRAGKNLGSVQSQGFRLKVDDSLTGQVVQTGRPMRRGGKGTGRDFKVKTGYLVKSLLHVPLILRDKAIGVLSVDNQVSDVEFTDEDQYLLSTLADYAAISIENATLYDELRKNIEHLKLSQQELIQSSKLAAVGTLAAGVAHEFNNLLAAISGHTELGLVSSDMQEIKRALEVVMTSVDRARRITTNLLTFARRRETKMEVTDITEAVENPLQLLERDLEKSNVEIVRKYYETPPVHCDVNQLSQVCLNLITNARDAMLPDGGTLTVQVKQDGDEVVLAFADTGSGIPDYVMENLFQPFVTTKGPLGGGEMTGSGLGLSVSYGIVKNHGGTIDVDTQPGRGSTFTVRLPIKGAEAMTDR
ncbi:MAG: response regulator [Anaerolineae bacterium]|nr:response regulator [Anaerolineae bacterium]NIN93694.1 response regulator [Anaerolineae bacterium]NIQ76741.1 response regulator [Anaerolineae bacterium]